MAIEPLGTVSVFDQVTPTVASPLAAVGADNAASRSVVMALDGWRLGWAAASWTEPFLSAEPVRPPRSASSPTLLTFVNGTVLTTGRAGAVSTTDWAAVPLPGAGAAPVAVSAWPGGDTMSRL